MPPRMLGRREPTPGDRTPGEVGHTDLDPHGSTDDRALAERVRRRFEQDTSAADPAQRITELLLDEAPLLTPEQLDRRARLLAIELVGLGPIQQLLEDPSVSDVLVNGPGPIWVERSGRLERSSTTIDDEGISRSIERLVGPLGLRADRSSPIVDARLPDGTRVAVVLPPLAVDGPLIAVRRHRAEPVPLEAFGDDAAVALLLDAVTAHRNVVVYGPTGGGKTTLLNALAGRLDPRERVVTIEDVAELQLPGEHVVRLEARPGSADGVGRAAVRDLVRAALRLRPDRIVVGEVRGAEAVDMIWALSTGHDGSFTTCHAAGPEDAVRRLETMCLMGGDGLPIDAIRSQVRSAVHLLVGVGRSGGAARRITGVHRLEADGSVVPLHLPTDIATPNRCDGVPTSGAAPDRGPHV